MWRIPRVAVFCCVAGLGVLAGCSEELDGPTPTTTRLEPALVCNAQLTTAVTVHGSGMSPMPVQVLGAPGVDIPTVELGQVSDLRGAPVSGTTPVLVPDDTDPPHVRWTSQDLMSFDVYEELVLAPGVYALTLTNRNGHSFRLDPAMTAVPPPTLAAVDPDLICVAEVEQTLTLTGEGFLQVGDALPTVTAVPVDGSEPVVFTAAVLGDCFDVAGPTPGVRSCTSLTFTIPVDGLASTTADNPDYAGYDLVVTNPAPAACSTSEPVRLTVVPPPVVLEVDPPVICNADHDTQITLIGDGFLEIDGELPTVTVGGAPYVADGIDGDCVTVEGPAESVRSCTTLTITLAAGTLEPGSYEIGVSNPAPAGCTTEATATLVVVPPPVLASIVPDLVCLDESAIGFTITGDGLIRWGDDLPTVTVGGVDYPADDLDDCTPITGEPGGPESCTELVFTIPGGDLPPGTYDVTVSNPAPIGCVSPEPLTLVIVGAPVVTSIEPPIACMTGLPSSLTLVGEGFLVVDGVQPTVTIDGAPVVVTAVGGCVPIEDIVEDAQSCTSITVTFPAAAGTIGSHVIGVVNPPPAACAAASVTFDVALPPEITGVTPARVCSVDFTVTITGANFMPGTQVFVGGTLATSTTYVSPTQIQASFPAVPAGVYDVTVSNGAGCDDTLPGGLTVIENPVVFFVDPPVVYNGINTQVTIFASGVIGTITSVTITPAGGGTAVALVFTFDPARPNRILATVPSGTAAGVYDVSVTTDLGCGAVLGAGLRITDTLTLALEAIDPPFGWTGGSTAVVLTATDPPPTGEVSFAATPRAYLNPTTAGALATPLRSVVFVDEAHLNAVVPSGLAAGVYDVIVVNPDGAVGLLDDAFSVGTLPPPVIDGITPASVINTVNTPATATGSDFRSPTAEVFCRDPATGAITTRTATVTGSTATTVDFTFPGSGLVEGSVCVVRITNDDGTYADYSAVSVTNPAANLQPPVAGTTMGTARRAPASVAGRATRVSRFVYAIGGDSGAATGAFATAEAAPVGLYGDMGAWSAQSNDLPGPRTLAGVAILGRYVYLVGGNGGSGAVGQVHRAKVLDPEQTPELTDLDLRRGGGTGLTGGTWHYRVSAVRPAGDPDNPGGETLTSDPLPVLVPSLPERVQLTIYWTGLAGSTAYRIYRSPAADAPSGSELLLAEVPASGPLSYTDTGAAVGTQAPLHLGDLGRWAVQPGLVQPREAPGVTVVADPATAGLYHLYAVGGRTAAGTLLRTHERASITVAADGSQTLGAWTENTTNLLSVARWQAYALRVGNAESSRVPAGTTYVYLVAGRGAAGAVSNVDVAAVQAGGALGAWSTVTGVTPAHAGYGYAAANNQLFIFGGQGAAPSNTNRSSQVCGPGVPGCIGGPPALANWNALGFNLTVARYLMGSAVESAFIFLVGGDSTGGPTATTETMVW